MAEHKFYLTTQSAPENLATWAPGWDGPGSSANRYSAVPASNTDVRRDGFIGQANAQASEAPRSEYVKQFYVPTDEIPLGPISGTFRTAVSSRGIYYQSGAGAVMRAIRVIVSVVNSIGVRKGIIFDQMGSEWSSGTTSARTVEGDIIPGTTLAAGDQFVVEYGGWIGPHPSGSALYDTTVHFEDLANQSDVAASVALPDIPFVEGQELSDGYNPWLTFDLDDEPQPSTPTRYYFPSSTEAPAVGPGRDEAFWEDGLSNVDHPLTTIPSNGAVTSESVSSGALAVPSDFELRRFIVSTPRTGTLEGSARGVLLAIRQASGSAKSGPIQVRIRVLRGDNTVRGVLLDGIPPGDLPVAVGGYSETQSTTRTFDAPLTPVEGVQSSDRIEVSLGFQINTGTTGNNTKIVRHSLTAAGATDYPFEQDLPFSTTQRPWVELDLVNQTPAEPVPTVTSRYYLLDPPSFTIGNSGDWAVTSGTNRTHLTSTVPVTPLATNSTSVGENIGGVAVSVLHRTAALPPVLHEGTVEGASFRLAMAFYNAQSTSATMQVEVWLRGADGTNKGALGEFYAPSPLPGGTTRHTQIAEGTLPTFEAEPGDRVVFDIGMWMNNTTTLSRAINSASWQGSENDLLYEQNSFAEDASRGRPWIEFTAPQGAALDPDADVARYYFDPHAVPDISPDYSPDWLITTGAQRRVLRGTHFVGSNPVDLSAVSEGDVGTSVMLGRQYIGGTVPEGPIRGRLRSTLRASSQFADLADDRVRVIVRVVSADGTVVRGVLCDAISAVEVPGPSNLGTVTVEAPFAEGTVGQPGDLLTIEYGASGSLTSGTMSGSTLYLGGQSTDAADYAFADGVTEAGLYPWVELAFDPPPPSPTALTQTERTFTSVALAFTPPEGEAPDSYEYRVDGGAPVSLGTSTSLSLSDLTHTTAYEVEVRALYDSTPSAWTSLVASTRTVYPPTIWVIPGPEGTEPWAAQHHGRFRIADFGEFAGYVSLGIKVSADRPCHLTIFARWSRWVEGTGFEPVGEDMAVHGPSSIGDDSGEFLYRSQIFIHQRAPEGATHWQPVLRGTDDPDAISGLVTGTKVRFDDLYVPDNGYRIDREPYLDGDQPKGRWEGPRAASTSVYGGKASVPLSEIITLEPELLVPDAPLVDPSDLIYLDDDITL